MKNSNPYVLVVDDYLINLELTKEMLEILGCRVDTAENGHKALDLFNQNHYDLIFMDIQMPDLDGYQVVNVIRKIENNERHVPIVALTANVLEADDRQSLTGEMDAYLTKPVKIKDLEGMIEKLLR